MDPKAKGLGNEAHFVRKPLGVGGMRLSNAETGLDLVNAANFVANAGQGSIKCLPDE